MRRIIVWLASTVAAVVLLLTYRTSTMGANGAASGPGARIDAVSGATVTSNGYQQSLQSALDAAHFK
jgi:Na+-transporting NADH:ubiquinone oxidoreductase subunit NqrC